MAMTQRNPGLFGGNRFKLGVFAFNVSGGLALVDVPERWDASWDNNLAVAQMADTAGIECLVPLQRWKGYGGKSNVNLYSFESLTWASGLLAHTSHISVFATVHSALVHPVFAAKQAVTADMIGGGRFGLNLVPGSNADEFRMFGVELGDHPDRYAMGQEWWDIVRRVWSGEEYFDYDGTYFKLQGVIGRPRPYGDQNPPMMNAGASPVGRAFALRNSDLHYDFCIRPEDSAPRIRESKAQAGRRELQVWAPIAVVCRPTQAEVNAYLQHCIENADWGAVDKRESSILAPKGSKSQTPEEVAQIRTHEQARAAIGRSHYALFGTPDMVAKELARLSEAGFDGVAIGFVNYRHELPYFVQEVIPRLERMGLRRPVPTVRLAS